MTESGVISAAASLAEGDDVQIVGKTGCGKWFHDGRATLHTRVYQLWWMVRFRDGVIEKRQIVPEAQQDPAAWCRQMKSKPNPERN
jgi:hypothetical protein